MKKKIDIGSAPISAGSRYPEPFAGPCQNKIRHRLGVAAGLKHIGINLLELAPGAWPAALAYPGGGVRLRLGGRSCAGDGRR